MVLPVAHQTLSGAQAEHQANWPLSGFFKGHFTIIQATVTARNSRLQK
jgi:hypothetical protein